MEDELPIKTQTADSIAINDEVAGRLHTFLKKLYAQPLPRVATFSFEVAPVDPLAYLENQWEVHEFQYHWEHPNHNFALSASGSACSISAKGKNRFRDIQANIKDIEKSAKEFTSVDHPYSGCTMVGGFSFFDEYSADSWQSFKPAQFIIPKWTIIKNKKSTIATFAVNPSNFEGAQQLFHHLAKQHHQIHQFDTLAAEVAADKQLKTDIAKKSFPAKNNNRNSWTNSVKRAQEIIDNDDLDKVVLARKITVPHNTAISPVTLLNRLRQQYPECYNFLIHQPNNSTFLGSTPERLGTVQNSQLFTEALAGSIRRGQSDTADVKLEEELRNSPKNLHEHNFVIQDIKEQLKPIAANIDYSTEPKIKKLANVQHLYTPMDVSLQKNTHILDVVKHMHPTPAVGGYPSKKAITYIKKLEHFNRGWYAGPVGWFNSCGTGSFAVAIRSGLMTQKRISFFAGCGIVSDSGPQEEWEETNLKFKPMLSALQYN